MKHLGVIYCGVCYELLLLEEIFKLNCYYVVFRYATDNTEHIFNRTGKISSFKMEMVLIG